MTSPPPLRLALHPLLPERAPGHGNRSSAFGVQLRIADGPALADGDPLLQAFGACVCWLLWGGEANEALQDESFAPGRRLTLRHEGVDDDGDDLVGVWDADVVRRAGIVPYTEAAHVAAAMDVGLEVEALVLTEMRTVADDRRCTVKMLVHAPALVDVDATLADALNRPRRAARRRLVLVADRAGSLSLWDPSGAGGPLDVGELPISDGLAADLEHLSAAYAEIARVEHSGAAAEPFSIDMARSALAARTQHLWERARAELGRSYAIGLQMPSMTQPAWAPSVADDDDDDVPF